MPSTAGVIASGYSVLGSTYNLLKSATLWLDADKSPIQGGYLYNLGSGGEALNARFGSSTLSDTNDPLVLPYTGRPYMYVPEAPVVGSNYTTSTNSLLDSVVGDLELVFRYRLDGFTTAIDNLLISRGYAGQFFLKVSPGSYMISNIIQGVRQDRGLPAPTILGQTVWLKVTRSASDGSINCYLAPDSDTEPTVWNFTSSATGITGNLTPSNVDLQIGRSSVAAYYRVIVRSGIGAGATTVFDADFTKGITSGGQSSFLESSPSAVTVTPLRDTSGRKTCFVSRSTILMGVDDYLEIPHSTLLDRTTATGFTCLVVVRQWNTPGNFRQYISKQSSNATDAGWSIAPGGAILRGFSMIGDGTNTNQNVMNDVWSAGQLAVLAMTVSQGSVPTVTRYLNNSSVVSTGVTVNSSANLLPVRIGSLASTVSTQDFEFFGAAVYQRALSASEIAAIVSYYGAS